MVSGEYPPISGGVGYYVRYLAQELVQNGFEVSVFTRGGSKALSQVSEGKITIYKLRYLPFFPFHTNFHGYFLNKFIKKKEKDIDVILLHSPSIPVISTELPKIVTEHGTVRGFIDGLEMKDLFSISLKAFRRLLINNDKNVLSSADMVTAVSESCKMDIEKNYEINVDHVVGNGVNHKVFTPIPIEERPLNTIIFCGAFITKKGIFDLLESIIIVKKEIPDILLKLVGTGTLIKSINKFIVNNNLKQNVKLLGYLNHHNLVEEYQNSSLYVLSSYHEGLPTATLEAMACGLPIITTNVDGNRELVENNYNGIIVPPKNPQAIASNIKTILNDWDLMKYMGNNSRSIIEKKYTWEKVSQKFIKIIMKEQY